MVLFLEDANDNSAALVNDIPSSGLDAGWVMAAALASTD